MTIVLCGGGSGGHITPLLAVARELRARNANTRLIYIGERGGKFTHIAKDSKLFDELHYISAGKLRRYNGESTIKKLFDIKTNILNIRDVFKIGAGLLQSYFLLKKLKPTAMLLKGGFVCVPVALAGHAHKIAYITHDSDALPGLSNRIAARWARYHATAMPAQYYSYPLHSMRVVGVPADSRFRVYSDAEKAILREKYGVPPNKRVVLITGGSNGARRLNDAVIAILPELVKENIHVLHQIGAGNQDQAATLDPGVATNVDFFEFSSELFHMSAIADVVVTRAGASAVADFGNQGKACIIVPNPFLTGGHQLKNAQVFQDAEAARIVSEDDLKTPQVLREAIVDLLNDTKQQKLLASNLYGLIPHKSAALSLAELLEEVAR